MASRPIPSWQIAGETMETVTDFIFWGSKITADTPEECDTSHHTTTLHTRGVRHLTPHDDSPHTRSATPHTTRRLTTPEECDTSHHTTTHHTRGVRHLTPHDDSPHPRSATPHTTGRHSTPEECDTSHHTTTLHTRGVRHLTPHDD